HMTGRPLHDLRAGRRSWHARREVDRVGRVPAEQLPAVMDIPQAGAPRGAVQGEIFVSAERAPVQPGDLVRRAANPLLARRRPHEQSRRYHSVATPSPPDRLPDLAVPETTISATARRA